MVSRTISLPCLGYFSPFPHGTGSLSVSQEYLALPDGPGGFIQDFSCPALLRILVGITIFRLHDFHILRLFFPKHSSLIVKSKTQSYNPNNAETMLVWAIPASLATTKGITFVFFSCGYLDVSVPHVCFLHCKMTGLQPDGLPHSEISGSQDICSSPPLIAAYHVLLRL